MWRGRGWRNWYYMTGMPGWVRASIGYPAFGFCRWFPWLPRGWWSGTYGISWPWSDMKEYLRREKQMLQEELKLIEKRLKELEGLK